MKRGWDGRLLLRGKKTKCKTNIKRRKEATCKHVSVGERTTTTGEEKFFSAKNCESSVALEVEKTRGKRGHCKTLRKHKGLSKV